MSTKLGISGSIAKLFLQSEITPLLALVGLLAGIFAVVITPREEEPQINVTFANIFIPFPGASAREVEQFVNTPAEQVLMEIRGIEHVYSVSRSGLSILGAFFILDDPIFSGLAVSLIFGILVSTLLTLLIIPVLYYAFKAK